MTVQPTRDQLRALADKATPGPWEAHGSLIGIGRAKPDFGQTWGLRWRQDIEFICAAREAVPQLLDQLAAAEQRIRDLTQEVQDERGAALDQMEQVKVRDARIERLENRAASETTRANTWRDKHRIMAGKRNAAHRAHHAEREARREAEERLAGVQSLIDKADIAGEWYITCSRLQWALDG